jgi:methionyl-tRNA synthetase
VGEKQRILVTSALPYANGPLHVGQLAGAYLPADVFVRYHRLLGNEVVYICGSDEHGVAITLTADAQGTTPRAIVDEHHPHLKRTFERLNFSLDHYGRTTSPVHHDTARKFFSVLHDAGFLYTRTVEQFYDASVGRWLPDRYVEGTCPHCGSADARGDECESCGRWIEARTLVDPKSKLTGASPELRETTHWYFKLSELEEEIKRWVEVRDASVGWKDNVLNYCRSWFRDGLKDRPVTRDLDWGVRVPLAGAEGKVIYVWFENVLGYVSNTKEWAEGRGDPDRWRNFWLDPECRLFHFIGKDNIIFHAILFPAMILAYNRAVPEEERFVLPENVPANEFLNVEGKKLSTSRNWAVWVDDVLDAFPTDYLRYYMTFCLPETRDTDFSWDEFAERVNSELADIYGNLVNRTLVFIHRYFEGVVPEPGKADAAARALGSEVARLAGEVARSIEGFRFREAAKLMMDVARAGNKYFDEQRPWVTRKEEPAACARTMYHLCQTLASLAVVSEPFIPETSVRLAGQLGVSSQKYAGWRWGDAARGDLVPAGTKIGETEVLFAKVEPEQIEEQRAKLGETRVPRKEEPVNVPPLSNVVLNFDEFEKMDLRVARVVVAERVPETEKLLRMEVDLGVETRQIVAGIAGYYEPEVLLGRLIIVLVNLKPVTLRGVESRGMLLAATEHEGDGLRLLTLDGDIPPGSKVS